jgi:hypothetical protein
MLALTQSWGAFATVPVMDEITTELHAPHDDEEQRVREWRISRLEHLGVSNLTAAMFATLVDWHEIAALVQRGCSPDLAVEIVR